MSLGTLVSDTASRDHTADKSGPTIKAILEDLDLKYTKPIQPILMPRAAGMGGSPYLDFPPSPRSGPRRAPAAESRETLGNAGYLDPDPLGRSPSRSLRPGGDRF